MNRIMYRINPFWVDNHRREEFIKRLTSNRRKTLHRQFNVPIPEKRQENTKSDER